MPREPLIGIVGKPSCGKSTTLNSLTHANAKVGAFPFTTIDPNRATGYLKIDCACGRFGKEDLCKPNYGWCEHGSRHVPIELLDVAGLIPGASQGLGLGNKFLDDLRHADALIQVVDVSGTTDAEGKATRGYDPLQDIQWLQDEIRLWIENNLHKKWNTISRRHVATKSTTVETLRAQLGGYGASKEMVAKAVRSVPNLPPLEKWDNGWITRVVKAFMKVKFPTVLALNKIDHPDADKNVSKIMLKYPEMTCVLTSALTEVFLRKLEEQGYIKYEPGTEFVDTYDDLGPDSNLKPMDPVLKDRVESIRDLVLYRFGSTGVVQVLQEAAKKLDLVPVYTVRNIQTFAGGHGKYVFRDCTLFKRGTTVNSVARAIMGEVTIASAEGVGGKRVAMDDIVEPGKNDILSFKVVPGKDDAKKDEEGAKSDGKAEGKKVKHKK